METMFYITRQTTESGTVTEVNKATGRNKKEATLNAKIKAYKAMESFKNEPSMINTFIGVSDLIDGYFVISEYWEKDVTTLE